MDFRRRTNSRAPSIAPYVAWEAPGGLQTPLPSLLAASLTNSVIRARVAQIPDFVVRRFHLRCLPANKVAHGCGQIRLECVSIGADRRIFTTLGFGQNRMPIATRD